jgi:hypothetical protein
VNPFDALKSSLAWLSLLLSSSPHVIVVLMSSALFYDMGMSTSGFVLFFSLLTGS